MGWVLVVSGDEGFQREAVGQLRESRMVVGAVGDSAARRLVREIDVQAILVDSLNDVGRRFLQTLASLPETAVRADVITVGTPETNRRFQSVASLDAAIGGLDVTAAA